MSSPADVKIKNRTTQKITTNKIRDLWVVGNGSSINGKVIEPGEEKQFRVVAKTGHHGELDINLVGNNSQILGQFKIKSIKDPQNSGALVNDPFQDFFNMSSIGYRRISGEDKDLRRIELEVANQVSVSSGWDIVNANQKNEVNDQIKSLYDNGVLPDQFKSVNIGCPEIVGGKEDDQGEVTIKVPLEGIIKVLKVSGACEFTVNLKNISGSIESDEDLSYTLFIDLKGDILSNIDLSGLVVKVFGKEISTSEIKEIVLQFTNNFFKSLESIDLPFNSPIPLSLNDASINFTFVENGTSPDRSFLAILVGLHGNKGTYQLSKDVIYNSSNSTTAFVFSNLLFMTACKEMLSRFLGDDFEFSISEKSPFEIINNGKVTLKDGGFWGINAEIKKNDFVFKLDSNGNLKMEIKLRYQTSKLLPWSSVKIKVDIKPSTENGLLVLNISGTGNPPWWLWIVFPPLAVIFDIVANKHGVAKLTIPNFYCDQISIPTYLRLSGKWNK